MWTVAAGEGAQFAIVSRRNNSSSQHARLLVFGSLGLFTLSVGIGFALIGAWPVMPFAGIECVALFLAYRWLQSHDDDFELITIDADHVVVQARDGSKVERHQLNRHWAQVVTEESPGGRVRVFLRVHGREVDFGRLLVDDARLSLAKRLREQLSRPVDS
ncbi:MAG: DUF2244 domain-containing protein [Betaproteobacteria bacterium]|nr:MAG: DUF2244 domain-containing protein [Betaproteobacteria bacterium]